MRSALFVKEIIEIVMEISGSQAKMMLQSERKRAQKWYLWKQVWWISLKRRTTTRKSLMFFLIKIVRVLPLMYVRERETCASVSTPKSLIISIKHNFIYGILLFCILRLINRRTHTKPTQPEDGRSAQESRTKGAQTLSEIIHNSV